MKVGVGVRLKHGYVDEGQGWGEAQTWFDLRSEIGLHKDVFAAVLLVLAGLTGIGARGNVVESMGELFEFDLFLATPWAGHLEGR